MSEQSAVIDVPYRALSIALIACVVLRILSLGALPLLDPSEPRFANAALRMIATNDWVTPQIFNFSNSWVNYWAKPPFHMWMTAVSFLTFGSNEFAARFPGFLDTMLTAIFLSIFCVKFFGRESALRSTIIFLTMLGTFFLGSGCITDPALMMSATGALVSFALCENSDERIGRWWGLLFFLMLGIGMLTKGPVALVLPGVSIGLYILFGRKFSSILKLPWILGMTIFLVVSVPWYLLAEFRTPGYLEYFFVTENFRRYFFKDVGILYGSTHKHPFGAIWLMLLGASLPWSISFFRAFTKKTRGALNKAYYTNSCFLYVAFWAIGSALFFTAARQVLPTYVLPALPAVAILVSELFLKHFSSRGISYMAGGCAAIYAATTFSVVNYISGYQSTKSVVQRISEIHVGKPYTLGVLHRTPQSLTFYRMLGRLPGAEVATSVTPEDAYRYNQLIVEARDLNKRGLPTDYSIRETVGDWAILTKDKSHVGKTQ